MPYIKPMDRKRATTTPSTVGDLNYAISRLCLDWLQLQGDSYSYAALNSVVGVLECAKLEFSRRVLFPYEDAAKERNGDIY